MIPIAEAPHVARILVRVVHARLGGPITQGSQCLAVRDDGAFLLLKATYRRRWSLPGGFMDPGEEPVDAAVRELLEETGVAVVDATLEVSDRRRFHADHLVVANVPSDHRASAATTAWEVGATRWVTVDELAQMSASVHPNSARLLDRLPGGLRHAVQSRSATAR